MNMGAVNKIMFSRWQERGLVRYRVALTYDDQSTRVLDNVDYVTLVAEIGEGLVEQIDRRKCDKGTITLNAPTVPQRRTHSARVRVEVVLRRENPDERAVLAAIEKSPGYGRRSDALRDWLVKGYLLLKQEADHLVKPSGSTQILDIVAVNVHNHRLFTLYVNAQKSRQQPALSVRPPP
ncbi:MAG: hypothetical protein FWF12_06945 [Betaproteobacteria bacterium]|nr:hypothetical protein [Betaproteobacteria bacterium]